MIPRRTRVAKAPAAGRWGQRPPNRLCGALSGLLEPARAHHAAAPRRGQHHQLRRDSPLEAEAPLHISRPSNAMFLDIEDASWNTASTGARQESSIDVLTPPRFSRRAEGRPVTG